MKEESTAHNLEAFKLWVLGLTWKELQSAMTLSFPLEGMAASSTTAKTTTGNLELDLLREMIHLQAPPPTPIHARAVPYCAASTNKWSDGRNETDRIRRDRIHRPRLFQWRERGCSSASIATTTAYTSTTNTQRQWLNHHHSSRQRRQTPFAQQFDVHAQRFVQPNGDRWSVGCTWEQQQADATLIFGSCFCESPDGQVTQLRFFQPNPRLLQSCCCFSDDPAKAVRRLLTVASRGRFMSVTAQKNNGNSSNVKNVYNGILKSPWLDPTEQWFSLAMYLASRYELALWESFRHRSQQPLTIQKHRKVQWWPGIQSLLTDKEIEFAVAQSVVRELRNDMLSMDFALLMDSMPWYLLVDNSNNKTINYCTGIHVSLIEHCDDDDGDNVGTTVSRFLRGIVTCPITEIDSRLESLRRAARRSLQDCYVTAAEHTLTLEIEEHHHHHLPNDAPGHRKRGAKHKKKKNFPQMKKASVSAAVVERDVTAAADPFSGGDSDEQATGTSSSDEAGTSNTQQDETTTIAFPDNGTATRERNRNIVTALSIVDQVLNAVLAQVDTSGDAEGSLADSALYGDSERARDEDLAVSSTGASMALSCGNRISQSSTKSTTMSPILMSLSGLSEMRKDCKGPESMKMQCVQSISSVSALSLPGNSELRSSHHQLLSSSYRCASPVRRGDGVQVEEEGIEKLASVSREESIDESGIREERDTYRDLCLTLGAEVAKLKNMLATQKSVTYDASMDFSPTRAHLYRGEGAFDPASMPRAFDIAPRARTLAAMSDAGFRGEHESQASEDEGGRLLKGEGSRHLSSGATLVGSEVSVDPAGTNHFLQSGTGVSLSRVHYDPVSLNGMQSRLTRDIQRFLEETRLQLQKQEPRRQDAIMRMTRLVNTVWPRAQVKLYGSSVSGLSLPSSDLDFVICLPAVHKNAPAVAPGVLEGRNAINETSQKLLARTLSGEPWIDPRSMKLIDRTPVPVIKVSTKGPRSRALQLDITFDSPGNHGIDAVHMVSQIMAELPMLRPLVLVLKQFLSPRGLLTSYSGGLSSYGLFLMIARYLQEQPSSWGDCGSLLMGFLDFYGNNVSFHKHAI
jgi:hypothetical protein